MKKFVIFILIFMILLFTIPFVFSKPISQGNVVLNGTKLYVNGSEFKIKGVAYQPTPIGQGPGYNFYNQLGIYNRDFSLLRNMSANTIRTWGMIQDGNFLNSAYNNGNKSIYVIMGFWINCNEDYNNSAIRQDYINDFGNYVATYKNYSAVLMWALGNENNLDYCTTASLVDDLNSMYNEMAKKAYEIEGSSYHPVAIINGDVIYLGQVSKKSDDASLDYIDVWGMNTYPGSSLTAKINEYSSLSSKPLFISEYGTDALNNSILTEYEETQAKWDVYLWKEIANSSITLGGTIMEYSDEWWKFNSGSWSVHDNGGYYPSWNPSSHPDSYVNEEYWGIVRPVDNGANPDMMQSRKIYYDLQGEFLKDDFVKVNGTKFYLNGKPFYFAGANIYYLWYGNWNCQSYDYNQGCSKEVLDDAKKMNLTVLRVWGFSDGNIQVNFWGQLQPQAGVYKEADFQRFDRLIKEAKDRNIKLIIPFVNYWNDFGGMPKYREWCNESSHDYFYTSNCTKTLYKNYVAYFLNRTNTLTGIKYKNDPTIFAWELANEPRAQNQTILDNWIEEMSTYIKGIDNNHLLTVGLEGFSQPPYSYGTDFIKNHNHSNIDFIGFHLLANNWGFTYQKSIDWINSHLDDAAILGKPVILEEIGISKYEPNRTEYFNGIYNLLESREINGDLFWMLKDLNYPDFDNYGIDYPENANISSRIIKHANYMNQKTIGYDVSKVVNGTIIEHRFYFGNHHFMTIIEDQGSFAIRPHPGVDVNGWGSSLYLQPFLPGATLKYTIINYIKVYNDKIEVSASGSVSKGNSETYGTWNLYMIFNYDQTTKRVNGNGSYNISLDGVLSPTTGDLNLFKIASNYLDDVPLLTGAIGDTGDMQYANVSNSFNFIWVPPEQPAHFPQDQTDSISIDVIGQLNNVDTAAQGYTAIEPAYKPNLNIILISQQAGIPMIFGGMYDISKSQDFWEDNVGITPLILEGSAFVNFNFNIVFNSAALPNDGIDFDFDGYNHFIDCNDSNISIHPFAVEICNSIDDDCDNSIDENNVCMLCIYIGSEQLINGTMYYCDIDEKLKLQKPDNQVCMNNFECLNNLCSNNVCVNIGKIIAESKSLLGTIINLILP